MSAAVAIRMAAAKTVACSPPSRTIAGGITEGKRSYGFQGITGGKRSYGFQGITGGKRAYDVLGITGGKRSVVSKRRIGG